MERLCPRCDGIVREIIVLEPPGTQWQCDDCGEAFTEGSDGLLRLLD